MTDIVEKLRDRFAPQGWLRDRCFDAADEIEQLRAQLASARDIMAGLICLERGSGEKALEFLRASQTDDCK